MKTVRGAVVAAILTCSSALPAQAGVQLGEHFNLSGFGTAGAVVTDTNDARFGRDRQPGGADKSGALDVDSNLGVQLNGRANDWLSGTVQVLAIKRDENRIEPEIEWAFLKVKPLNGLSLRAGRMALPTFLVSDSRNVGYANTWLRAPNEVYALAVFRRLEGADATYSTSIGSSQLTATALVGESSFVNHGDFANPSSGSKVKVKDVLGANVAWEYEGVTLRVGRMEADVLATDPVTGALVERSGYTFTGFGAVVDRGNVVAQAEYVTRRSDSATFHSFVNADGWYVMGGYRFNALTPYAIYSSTKPKDASFYHFSEKQHTTALGLRWDAASSIAVKFQVERVKAGRNTGTFEIAGVGTIPYDNPTLGTSFFSSVPNAFIGGAGVGSVNVVSAAVDFTF